MTRNLSTAFALSALASLPLHAATETHTLDATHSEVSFQVRHLISQVRGRFNDFDANIQLDREKPERSVVEFHVKAASIDTNLPDRDAHLRSADFFDAEKHPFITFKSRKIQPAGQNRYDVTGTLTMRGISKEITLPVTFAGVARDPWGNEKGGFSTETTLNRKDFGMVWNAALDNGGVILGDEVRITINLESVKAKDEAKGK